MKKRNCPNCGQLVYGKGNRCPYCGAFWEQQNIGRQTGRKNKTKVIGLSVAVLAGVALLGAIAFGSVKWIKDKSLLTVQTIEHTTAPMENKKEDTIDVEQEAKKIVESYNESSVTYDVAVTKLKDLKKRANSNTSTYDEQLQALDALKASKDLFYQASQYELAGEYKKAWETYGKVTQEDSNYKNAQEAVTKAKQSLFEQYIEKAKEKVKSQDYKGAITIIDTGLKEFPEDSTLKELKELYEKTIKEKQEQEKKDALKEGKTIKTDAMKAVFKKAIFTTTVKPEKTSGSYQYYKTKGSDNVWLDLQFTVKNKGKESLDLSTIISDMQVLSKKKTVVCQYGAYYSSGSSLKWAGSSAEIKSGKTVTYHLIVELPKKMKNSKDSLEVKFYMDGERQVLTYRK